MNKKKIDEWIKIQRKKHQINKHFFGDYRSVIIIHYHPLTSQTMIHRGQPRFDFNFNLTMHKESLIEIKVKTGFVPAMLTGQLMPALL